MLQLERIQDSLIGILTSSHHGKINPELLSPLQLKSELDNIKANLPPNLRLPDSSDQLLSFYKFMKIQGRALNDYIIFKITIELLTNDDFEVLKLISVPWHYNGNFNKIKSTFKILVINLHRDQYLPLKKSELNQCHQINDEVFICDQHQPLYKLGASVAACEVQLLSHKNKSECIVEKIDDRPHWIQLQNKNTWIYSIDGKQALNTVCGVTPSQILLENSGIIHLQANCNIKQSKISIQGYKKLETKRSPFYIPNDDIENLIERPKLNTSKFHVQFDDIDSLRKTLTNARLELPYKIGIHDIHHYSIIYICMGFIVIMAGVIYWKLKKKTTPKNEVTTKLPNKTRQPEPTPRQETSFITIPS